MRLDINQDGINTKIRRDEVIVSIKLKSVERDINHAMTSRREGTVTSRKTKRRMKSY